MSSSHDTQVRQVQEEWDHGTVHLAPRLWIELHHTTHQMTPHDHCKSHDLTRPSHSHCKSHTSHDHHMAIASHMTVTWPLQVTWPSHDYCKSHDCHMTITSHFRPWSLNHRGGESLVSFLTGAWHNQKKKTKPERWCFACFNQLYIQRLVCVQKFPFTSYKYAW